MSVNSVMRGQPHDAISNHCIVRKHRVRSKNTRSLIQIERYTLERNTRKKALLIVKRSTHGKLMSVEIQNHIVGFDGDTGKEAHKIFIPRGICAQVPIALCCLGPPPLCHIVIGMLDVASIEIKHDVLHYAVRARLGNAVGTVQEVRLEQFHDFDFVIPSILLCRRRLFMLLSLIGKLRLKLEKLCAIYRRHLRRGARFCWCRWLVAHTVATIIAQRWIVLIVKAKTLLAITGDLCRVCGSRIYATQSDLFVPPLFVVRRSTSAIRPLRKLVVRVVEHVVAEIRIRHLHSAVFALVRVPIPRTIAFRFMRSQTTKHGARHIVRSVAAELLQFVICTVTHGTVRGEQKLAIVLVGTILRRWQKPLLPIHGCLMIGARQRVMIRIEGFKIRL
mmetsp:Transcript_37837/g.62218  ORF Transcript_37837/g.62218 Transcript_37837/m.62218 type:complete len:390 (-) Transcript_37837:192-1361(-)